MIRKWGGKSLLYRCPNPVDIVAMSGERSSAGSRRLPGLSYREGKATELSDRNVAILQKWIDDLDSGYRLTGIQVFCEHSRAVLLLGRSEN
jgi:hypothetical protein